MQLIKPTVFSSIFLASSLLLAVPAQAFDMGNMMNPSKWMNKDKDRDRYYVSSMQFAIHAAAPCPARRNRATWSASSATTSPTTIPMTRPRS